MALDTGDAVARLTPDEQAALILAAGGRQPRDRDMPRAPRDRALPLSFAQEAMWLTEQRTPRSRSYVLPSVLRLTGPLGVDALRRALATIVARHDALRTSCPSRDGQPVQIVAPIAPFVLPVIDLEGTPSADAVRVAWACAAAPLDVAQGPLFRAALVRMSPRAHLLATAMHHLIADRWSMGIFVHELNALYQACLAGTSCPLAPLPAQYGDFAVWQRERLDGLVLASLVDYWKSRLEGLTILDLPADVPRPARPSFVGAHAACPLDAELSARLERLAHAGHATPFMVLLAGFFVLLHQYSGQTDLVVGTPVAGRPREELEQLIGLFLNMLVLRVQIADRPSFRTLIARVREMALAAYAHQELPFERLVEVLQPERSPASTPLFQVSFTVDTVPMPAWRLPGMEIERLKLPSSTTRFDLELQVHPAAEGGEATLVYNTDLYTRESAGRMLRHYVHALAAAADAPDVPIDTLSMLDPAERQAVLVAWNDTAAPAESTSLVDLLEAQAVRTPDALAIDGDRPYTYDALHRTADALAQRLHDAGVGPDVPVGVCLERSPALVVALLAVLKAGGAFVPLEPEQPPDRLAFMLAEAGVRAIITNQRARARLPERTVPLLELNDDPGSPAGARAAVPRWAPHPLQLAYVIYTSGSTGRPKGAMNTHHGLANRVTWMQRAYGLAPDDVVLQKTPCGFDVSVWEFFWPLIAGARLVLAQPGGHRDAVYLASLIQEAGVTTAHFVPAMLRAFVGTAGVERCRSLRRIVSSGEALSADLRDACLRTWPTVALHNLYGPTEAAIDVTAWTCHRDTPEPIVPIGRPIANTQVYVAGPDGQAAGIGMPGHLHLAGVCLARGYIGRPGLTAERFRPDPWSGRPGARTYVTGDRARWRADGVLEFLGRLDDQIKIRGVRIEPGEIETVLCRHDDIAEAVVVARAVTSGGPANGSRETRLVAYVVWRDGSTPDASAVRAYLRRVLPPHATVAALIPVTALPHTASGKVDRRASAELPMPDTSSSVAYVEPKEPLARWMAETWAELLGLERVGLQDHFFDLGGHSLAGMRVSARMRDAFDVDVPLAFLFDAPVLADYCARVAVLLHEQPDRSSMSAGGLPDTIGPDVTQLVSEIRGMSDEQVAAELAGDAPRLMSREGESSHG